MKETIEIVVNNSSSDVKSEIFLQSCSSFVRRKSKKKTQNPKQNKTKKNIRLHNKIVYQ